MPCTTRTNGTGIQKLLCNPCLGPTLAASLSLPTSPDRTMLQPGTRSHIHPTVHEAKETSLSLKCLLRGGMLSWPPRQTTLTTLHP